MSTKCLNLFEVFSFTVDNKLFAVTIQPTAQLYDNSLSDVCHHQRHFSQQRISSQYATLTMHVREFSPMNESRST